jgi:hypothetical protein
VTEYYVRLRWAKSKNELVLEATSRHPLPTTSVVDKLAQIAQLWLTVGLPEHDETRSYTLDQEGLREAREALVRARRHARPPT